MKKTFTFDTTNKLICCSILCLLFLYVPVAFCEIAEGEWVYHSRQAPQQDIESIFTLPDGNIWVSTDRSFHVFDGVTWKKIDYDTSILGNNPPFISDDQGRFYFLYNKKIKILDGNTITEYDSGSLVAPVFGAFSPDGSLYIASFNNSYGGIYKFDGISIQQIRPGRTRSLTVDFSGRLWAVHADPDSTRLSLLVLENDTWTDRTAEISVISSNFSIDNKITLQTSPDGNVWINNRGKYGILREEIWTFHDGGGVPVFLSFDNSGDVWGFGGNKIYRRDTNGNWSLSFTREKYIVDVPYFLAVTDSTVWTFDSNNVFRFSEGEENPWILEKSPYDLASDIITSIAYTDDGRLVCGHGVRDQLYAESEKAGISIFDGASWYNYNRQVGLKFENVYDLLLLDDGNIMVNTNLGFDIFDGYNWEKVDSLDVHYDTNTKIIEKDMILGNNGEVWIGTAQGLIEYIFESDYESLFPFLDVVINITFNNLFVDYNDVVYMQNFYKHIVSYDKNKENDERWSKVRRGATNTRDFIVDFEGYMWSADSNGILLTQDEISEWVISQDTGEEIHLPNASFIEYDEEGRIWASGFDNTGYLENGIWHRIPELSGMATNTSARWEEGKIALNAIEINSATNDTSYFGLYEFIPDHLTAVTEHKTESFSTITNYPNPFNSSTTISFELPEREQVTVSIYNITGQRVKTLVNGTFNPGINHVVWDGSSDSGISLASGIYFYRLQTKSLIKSGKMLLLR